MVTTRNVIKKKLMDFVQIGRENAQNTFEFEKIVGWFPKEYFSGLLGELYREGKISRISYTKGHATGFAYYIPNADDKEEQKIMAIFTKSGHQLTPKALSLLRKNWGSVNVEKIIEDMDQKPTIFVATEDIIQKHLQKEDIDKKLEMEIPHLTGLSTIDKAIEIFKRAEHLCSMVENLDNSAIQGDYRDIYEEVKGYPFPERFKNALRIAIHAERNELIRTSLNPQIIHYLDGKEGK